MNECKGASPSDFKIRTARSAAERTVGAQLCDAFELAYDQNDEAKDTDAHIDIASHFPLHPCRMDI